MEYLVDRNLLSNNKIIRRKFLDEYFSLDLIAFEELLEECWKLTTFTPDNQEYYVDPQLEKTLDSWQEPVKISEISQYKRFYKNCMVSFVDSWTAYYWSLVLHFQKDDSSTRFNLIHVDDHKDHDTPLIFQLDGKYYSLLSNTLLDFFDPKTVESIIQEKAITMGSFIAPFLHENISTDIFHLKYSYKEQLATYRLDTVFSQDALLKVGAKRPSIVLVKEPNSTNDLNKNRRYIVSSNIDTLLEVSMEDSITLLHIDCDAFSNRYNGSSAWQRSSISIDLSLSSIKREIDILLERVSQKSRNVYLNIALSPGFFPSEYWKGVLAYLLSRGEYYGIIRENAFSQYLANRFPQEVMHVFNA